MPAVFISYSRRDKDFVQRLHSALGERGYEVWVDWEDIPPSAQWLEEIRGGILGADGVIYVISPDSAASEVCTTELEHAVAAHKRIVPVVCRDPAPAVVPQAAAELNWVFMREGDDFDASLELLVQALETDLEHVRTHTRIGVEAERWEASGRERSQLLRGAELATAEAWLVGAADSAPAPSQLQREFLLASRQSATRRQRLVIGAVTVALGVAIVLAVIALILRSQAVHDEHLAKAALDDSRSEASLSSNPQQSVVNALAAVGIANDPTTTDGLRAALASVHLRERFTFPDPVLWPDALWSPNGKLLLVASPGVSTTIYRVGTRARPVLHLAAEIKSDDVAWDAQGNRVIVGGATTDVYDAANGAVVAKLPGEGFDVALSSDGSRAAVVDRLANGTEVSHLFDVATGAVIATFQPVLDASVDCFAWAPDNSVIAQCDSSASGQASLDLWNPTSGRLVRSDVAPELIDSVAFSPNSALYVYTVDSGSATGTFVDATATGAQVKTFPGGAVTAVFSPDGSKLAYASLTGGNLAYLYSFSGPYKGVDQPLVGATAAVDALSFNSTGSELVAGSEDGSTRVYDAAADENTGNEIETLADGDSGTVEEASFGDDDTEIVTSSTDRDARLWASPEPLPSAHTTLSGVDVPVASIGFTAGGTSVVEAGGARVTTASGQDGGAILNGRTLRLVARFATLPGFTLLGAGASRNGEVVAAIMYRVVADQIDAEVETFDGHTGRPLATFAAPAGTTLEDATLDTAGDRLLTSYANGEAEQWNPRSGRLIDVLHGSSQPAVVVAYSQSGSLLAVVHRPVIPPAADFNDATQLGPVTISLWNPSTGRLVRTLTGPDLTPLVSGEREFVGLSVTFTKSGNALALVGADRNVWAWNTTTGRGGYLAIPQGQFAISVAFSPNGQLLAAGGAAETFVWALPRNANAIVEPELQQANPSQYGFTSGGEVYIGFTTDSRVLITVGDEALKAWYVADEPNEPQIFDTPADSGNVDLRSDGLIAAVPVTPATTTSPEQLSVYPCALCGGVAELKALAAQVPGG